MPLSDPAPLLLDAALRGVLMALLLVLALVLGVPLGVYAALRRGRPVAQLLMGLSLIGVSLPTFLIGILLILVFAVTLGWFPSFGRGDTVQIGNETLAVRHCPGHTPGHVVFHAPQIDRAFVGDVLFAG
eukprot:gene4490-5325_t